MTSKKKQVRFDTNKNTMYETYSPDEYDRHQIDSILYQKAYNMISNEEWLSILSELQRYKLLEMLVHKNSINNIRLPG